ncbi:hypothetical protein L7F22_014063 [Adiantum nelumboides]|nr:hypothetical protein [Adiantum nelumboides]
MNLHATGRSASSLMPDRNDQPSSCASSHETVISIDRTGVSLLRSASLRPSRGVTGALDHGMPSTLVPAAITSSTASPALLPPIRSPPATTGALSARRFNLLSSGFWVSVELLLTSSQILAAIVVLALSENEHPDTPLPIWVIGYAVGCSVSLPLLCWRYLCHPTIADNFAEHGGPQYPFQQQRHHQQSTPWPVLSMPNILPIPYSTVTHSDSRPISSQFYSGVTRVRVEMCVERLRMTLDCFFAIWFVLGTVWVFGQPSAAQGSPKLYRLSVAFLALSCMGYAMPFVVCTAVCCCLPCLIPLLGFGNGANRLGLLAEGEGRGASADTISALPIVRFRSKRNMTSTCNRQLEEALPASSPSYSIDIVGDPDCCNITNDGGLIGAGTQFQRVIAGDDAACCICLGRYRDDIKLRALPCAHHFHVECIDQWLKINASCPLCKLFVQGGKLAKGEFVDMS